MNEHKFTKGPWELCGDDEHGDYEKHIDFPNGDIYIGGEGDDLEANANLIAAAPDLLKELESHCKVCQERNNWKNGCAGCFTERAIKKALGE